MINEFYEKLAKLAVNYSIEVKKGDRILILGPAFATEAFQAVYAEIVKAGGHPFTYANIEGCEELIYKFGSNEQLEYVDDVVLTIFKEFNGLINIFGDYNTRKLALIDPKLKAIRQGSPKNRELMTIYMKRSASGEFPWVIIPFSCNSFAQEANMDLFSYSEFVKKALYLDKEDPVKEWQKIDETQEKIASKLNEFKNKEVEVYGEDTELKFSFKDRRWMSYSGKYNLPDGEIATAPVEESINGKIRFTYPGIYQGQEIENIYLEFKEGKVVKSTASKGHELLQELLKIEGANMIGEFAVGTNYGVTKFTKNMLFDEKMGGTLHMALGLGLEEVGGKNRSAIHWDILKNMRSPGSVIKVDGTIVYQEGNWTI
jgi:aminopeptidase